MSLLPLLYYVIIASVAGLPDLRSSDYKVCLATVCREFGDAIQRNMNKSTEPCADFYEYGCGLWPANNPIPPNQLTWSTDDQLAMSIDLRIKEILENESEYDELPPIKMAKQYYRSCMNEDAIEEEGLSFMQSIFDMTGGWPILTPKEYWNTTITWQEIDNTYNQLFWSNSLFKIESMPDDKNSTRNILVVNQNRQYYLNQKTVDDMSESYILDITYMKKLAKVVLAFANYNGIYIPQEMLSADVMELVIFETNLKMISSGKERNQQLKTNQTRMTIEELQNYYDLENTQNSTAKIDWLQTIQFIFAPVNISITASEPVIVINKDFFHKLARLLDATPPRVIVNYIQWNIVHEFILYLNKEMRDIEFESLDSLYNVTKWNPRWKTCVNDMPMKDAVSYLFIKKYTSTDTLKDVRQMVDDIKVEMKARILRSTWANNEMKSFAIDKIDNILSQIGYPKWYDNQTAFLERYEGLKIGTSYFENILTNLIYENRREVANFRKPMDRTRWIGYPITVNAFYSETFNGIVIPAAEIGDSYFATNMPLAVRYATVGSTVGHELAHSFDSSGIQYDKLGNKLSWHNEETNRTYEERAKCFVDQYSKFTLHVMDEDGEPFLLNGEITKDENIADSVGIEVAFAAFQKRKSTAEPQPKLPGLTDISDEQLFFLSYVNAWCTASRETYDTIYANTDEHSPPMFRIIGSLANTKSFSEAFNCPVDSPMNPESKCSLWK